MDRAQYNACLRPHITGQKTKEQRKLDFCIGAKLCSSKAKTREEAMAVCSLPKEPKEPKVTRARREKPPISCKEDMILLSQCMADKIDMNLAGNPLTVKTALVDALLKCRCRL